MKKLGIAATVSASLFVLNWTYWISVAGYIPNDMLALFWPVFPSIALLALTILTRKW